MNLEICLNCKHGSFDMAKSKWSNSLFGYCLINLGGECKHVIALKYGNRFVLGEMELDRVVSGVHEYIFNQYLKPKPPNACPYLLEHCLE